MRSVQGSSPRISRASSSLALSEASEHEAEVQFESVLIPMRVLHAVSLCGDTMRLCVCTRSKPGPTGRISSLLERGHRVTIRILTLCYTFVSVQLDALLTRHVPDMELLSRAGGEVAYRLPKGDASR